MNNATTRESLPLLMSAKDIQNIGFSRTMAYQLLNMESVPVLTIGGRKFLNRDRFFEWLDKNTNTDGGIL